MRKSEIVELRLDAGDPRIWELFGPGPDFPGRPMLYARSQVDGALVPIFELVLRYERHWDLGAEGFREGGA
jgi:hypothetical protein